MNKIRNKKSPTKTEANISMHSKSDKIKYKTVEMLTKSSIHGLPYMIKQSFICVRIMWSLCFIASFITCVNFISNSITSYLDYEIVTIITDVYEEQSEFPTISFCSALSNFIAFPIFKCTFNSKDCLENFELFDDIYFGKCYRFNSGYNLTGKKIPILNITTAGPRNGLRLDINFTNEKNQFNELIIMVHNRTERPNSIRTRGLRFLSGSVNNLDISRIIDEKLEMPFNDCYKDLDSFPFNKTFINYFKNYSSTYNRVDCHRLCRNLHLILNDSCNCTSHYEDVTSCSKSSNPHTQKCYDDFLIRFQSGNVFQACANFCPDKCDQMSNVVSIFSHFIPGMWDSNNVHSEFPIKYYDKYDDIKRNYICLKAYYDELKYTHIQQIPKTKFYDLVSTIGGILGLFLGMSFLSFIELIELFIQIVTIIIKK